MQPKLCTGGFCSHGIQPAFVFIPLTWASKGPTLQPHSETRSEKWEEPGNQPHRTTLNLGFLNVLFLPWRFILPWSSLFFSDVSKNVLWWNNSVYSSVPLSYLGPQDPGVGLPWRSPSTHPGPKTLTCCNTYPSGPVHLSTSLALSPCPQEQGEEFKDKILDRKSTAFQGHPILHTIFFFLHRDIKFSEN